MKMKITLLLLSTCFMSLFLIGCSNKKSIQGEWHVSDAFEQNLSMTISEDDIIITTGGKEKKMTYDSLSNEDKNGVHFYCFKVKDDVYSVVFPDTHDHSTALFIKNDKQEDPYSGALIYAMNRDVNPDYRDYASNFFNN